MKLSLKEARRLEQEIQSYFDDQLNGLSISGVTVSAFNISHNSDLVEAVDDSGVHQDAMNLKDVIALRYKIRDMIARANLDCGITALMAKESAMKKVMQIHERFIVNTPLTEDKVNTTFKRIDAWNASDKSNPLTPEPTGRFSSGSGLSSDELKLDTIVSEDTATESLKEVKLLKKQLRGIVDECAALNINTKITLDESDTKFLTDLGIL